MLSKFRPRLTYANVVSSACLFVVLGGGAYAATTLPKNSVGNKQLKNNAVGAPEVRNFSLRAKDFKPGQLPKGEPGSAGSDAASAVLGNSTNQLTNAPATNVQNLSASGPSTAATGVDRSQLSPNATIVAQDLAVRLDVAPGGTASRRFTLAVDGAPTSPPLYCDIAGGATTCNSGATAVTIPPARQLSLLVGNVNGPAGSIVRFGWRATTP